ncbi:MAG: hypothetical protein RLZZ546_2419 [Bacteroidota bacterium]|jgi:predicted nucleotidyltransferase component of viral defense system
MISQKEVRDEALLRNVPANTVDKDYVLGHFINCLFAENWAQENFIFKGGTCLKKCYFQDYRFSEDIDITIVNNDFILLKSHLLFICKKITEQTNILFNLLAFEEQFYNDIMVGWNASICFWGANHSKNEIPRFSKECHTKIDFDFRNYEMIIMPTAIKSIYHTYSDFEIINSMVPCYSIEEILSEKLRAILQRNRGEARDYFDLWYIKNNIVNIDWNLVKSAFFEKCKFKDIKFQSVDDFFIPKRLQQVEITWDKRLKHQLPFDVDRDAVMADLKIFLKSLF